jgi:isopentenyl-diphosphate Delta-isomerase
MVILVNEKDEAIGSMEKMEAHRKGLLHRAFSIFIFNDKGDMLLQQRAMNKCHSAGLWTNACCSHPSPGESTADAALRRLQEEMGFTTPLTKLFDFIYQVNFENGLIEHELDHVFTGNYNGDIHINKEEVMDYCFKPLDEIKRLLQRQPQQFTAWFVLAFPMVENYRNQS